jgi:hypothetical protein
MATAWRADAMARAAAVSAADAGPDSDLPALEAVALEAMRGCAVTGKG